MLKQLVACCLLLVLFAVNTASAVTSDADVAVDNHADTNGGVHSADSTTAIRVSDIRIEGLTITSIDAVFAALALTVDAPLTNAAIATAIRTVYALGYFSDVRSYLDGDTLVFALEERELIASITIEGNKLLPEEGLLESLGSLGVKEGKLFLANAAYDIITAVRRAYEEQGYFNVQIELDATSPKNGYLDLILRIEERAKVSLDRIIITGNKHISDDDLFDVMQLQSPSTIQFFTNSYDALQLNADLEAIKNLYLTRGYLDAEILSSTVKVTPDEKGIYIVIDISEGEQYKVRNATAVGTHPFIESVFIPLVKQSEKGIYNQQTTNYVQEIIRNQLADVGYMYAEVTVDKVLDKKTKEVDVTFVVDAKQQQQVRFIHFQGNRVTADIVLRREMRQYENTTASQKAIRLSRGRLLRLGYFKTVTIETVAVQPGIVDLLVEVEEQARLTLSANISYSSVNKGGLGGQYSSINVLGTGQDIDFSIFLSSGEDKVSLAHHVPAFLDSGYSLRTTLYYQQSRFTESDISNYRRENNGLKVALGYALSERQRIEYGLAFDVAKITVGSSPVQEITTYVNDEGTKYVDYIFSLTHSYSSLNSGFLPTSGLSIRTALESTLPSSDAQFAILSSRFTSYVSLFDAALIWRFNSNLGYGFAYGDTKYFPFYRYFNVGDLSSLRGFQYAGVGPRSLEADGDLSTYAFGGNALVSLRNSLIYGTEGMKANNVRMSLFLDVANSYNTDCILLHAGCEDTVDLADLRASYGVAVIWYSVIAPMTFSYAIPLNATNTDLTRSFQFGLGVAAF